ncbi:MAG: hypothetical protein AB7N76_18545 [Planctomycetota bacterium]
MTTSPNRPDPLHVSSALLQRVLEQHALTTWGIHGVGHWARVLVNGVALAAETGASLEVVQLFALFHDARRMSDGTDPEHGRRGGDLARAVRGDWFQLGDDDLERLWEACVWHSEGRTDHPDVTVQTCWDADRLDLSRLWITPDKKYLSTAAAKGRALREAAVERGRALWVPGFVEEAWGLTAPAGGRASVWRR